MRERSREKGFACEYDNYQYPEQSIDVTPENRAEYEEALSAFLREIDAICARAH